MAEFDFVSIALPAIIAAIISFVLLGINKFSKTSEGTLSGTIRLEHVTTGMRSLEERMDKKLDHIDQSISKIWDELDDINATMKLNIYRLDRLEKNSK